MHGKLRALCRAFVLSIAVSVSHAATFTVTSTAASGTGSFAAAITQANSTAGADTINFGLSGIGVQTLSVPTNGYPTITETLVINGYSQTAAVQNTLPSGATNAVLRIQLDATGVPSSISILRFGAAVTIRGLAFNNMATGVIPILVQSSGAGSAIHGCFFGTNTSGTASGLGAGVDINASTQIGSSAAADRNLFAGTSGAIFVSGSGTVIQGNLFGTFANGTTGGNQGLGQGVAVRQTASQLLIGGTAAGQGNVFRDISGIGIRLFNSAPVPTGITIQGNSIDGTDGLPIDLGSDGVDPIDPGDPDTGPNNRENTLQLLYARRHASQLRLQFFADGDYTAGGKRLEFFASPAAHPSGSGPGNLFLGAITLNGAGIVGRRYINVNLTVPDLTSLTLPQVITATITAVDGSTSEFSSAVPLEEGGGLLVVTTVNDSGAGSLRQAILNANANAGTDAIIFNIAGTGPHVIAPTTLLPSSNGPLIIDGYSEPDAEPNSAPLGSNAQLQIVVDGTAITGNPILTANAGTLTVRGLNLRDGGNSGIAFTGGSDHVVEGCFIGTNATGLLSAGNSGNGVSGTDTVTGVRIGGSGLHQRNVISNNGAAGINLTGNDWVIENNVIGVSANGTTAMPNAFGGVFAAGTGGLIVGNRVRSNGSRGIGVATTTAQVDIRGNAIFGNTGLGIDLNNDGLTTNDTNDGDVGPNGLQNFPILSSATTLAGGGFRINGELDRPLGAHGFRFDVFSSPTCDSSGHGEGETFLGSTTLAFNAAAPETFQFTLPGVAVPNGTIITATASTGGGATSEFSPCITSTVQTDAVFANGFE